MKNVCNLRRVILTAFVIMFAISIVVSRPLASADPPITKARLSLELSVVLGDAPTTLDCTATNTSDNTVELPELGYHSNSIVITTPDGRKLVDADTMEHFPTRRIGAKEKVSWRINILETLNRGFTKEDGVYKVRWVADNTMSNELLIRRVPIEKEKPN